MRRDRISNEKIIQFYVPKLRTVGTFASGVYDLRQGGSGEGPGREVPTNCMLILGFGAGGDGNTVTITVSTGDNSTTTSFVTVGAMTKGTSDLWLAEFRDLQRYISLSAVVAGGSTHFYIVGSFNRSRREPVIQRDALEAAVTYNKSPATG